MNRLTAFLRNSGLRSNIVDRGRALQSRMVAFTRHRKTLPILSCPRLTMPNAHCC